MVNPNVMIAVPTYDRKIYSETALTIMDTIERIRQRGGLASLFFGEGYAIIHHARNAIITKFLSNPEATHLLFVDADMAFSGETIVEMLRFNVPFVGIPYVQKSYANEQTARYQPKDLDTFHQLATRWTVKFENPGVLAGTCSPVSRGQFARILRIGAGVILLRRDMIETMVATFANTAYTWDGPLASSNPQLNRFYDLFGTMVDSNGLFIGEDYAFCDRWIQQCGGEIWCNLNARCTHLGHHEYSGTLSQSIALRRASEAKLATS